MSTCKITVEILVDDKVVKTKMWPACDIMRTGSTRSWASRQYNAFLKDFNGCDFGKDKVVVVDWRAHYGKAQGFNLISGRMSGVNGKTLARRGIFED